MTENSTPFTMPVAPAYAGGYGGNGGFFGGDWAWILLLLLIGGNGWGFGGFGGGYGAMMGMDYGLYPWLNNSEHISDGFRDQMIQTNIASIGDKITSGFGDVATALCGGFAGVNANITNAAMNNQQNLFGVQSALQNCCCENRAGLADLKYTVATENCADRAALSDGIRDVLAATQAQTQTVLDKLCALELDGVKAQLAQAQRDNVGLQNALNMATMRESQTAQTAQILAGQAAEIDGVYNRLKNCPVGTYSVCNPYIYPGQGQSCGCGGNFMN